MRRRMAGACALLMVAAPLGAQTFPVSPELPPEARQFDFWLGEWTVNLRERQEDLTWPDTRTARAHIYPILSGKAVLELWDETDIKGFSLRYYEPDRDAWVLWLNWPGPNRSGSSSLEGSFRHARGEFYSTSRNSSGGERLTRYTFSDITDRSLRWADAFSDDGGRTWFHSWIMEFSRTADRAALPSAGGETHTFAGGGRCTLEPFRRYEALAGRRSGVLGGGPTTLRGYRVLGGCAVILLAGGAGAEAWFGHLTWNSYASRMELLELDARPHTPARIYYGAPESTELTLLEGRNEAAPLRRVRVELEDAGGARLVWEERSADGAPWRPVREGRFGSS